MPPSRRSRQSSRRTTPRRDESEEGTAPGSRTLRRPGTQNVYGRRGARRSGMDDDEARTAAARARSGQSRPAPLSARAVASDEEQEETRQAQAEASGDEDSADEGPRSGQASGIPGNFSDADVWKTFLESKEKLNETERAKKLIKDMGKFEFRSRTNDLVRMALFCQHRGGVLRREDITKKILKKEGGKDYSGAFPRLFNRAQKMLRFTFGYELVELRARGTDNEQIIKAQTQAQSSRLNPYTEEEMQLRKPVSSKTWALRSVLPASLIAQMNAPQSNLAACVARRGKELVNKGRDKEGVMLDWEKTGSELGSMGLLYLVLGLILMSGRTLGDDFLRMYLRRVGLEPSEPLPENLQPRRGADFRLMGKMTLDDYLDSLVKRLYLERVEPRSAAGTSAASHQAILEGRRKQVRGSGRKNRRSGGDDDSFRNIDWRWGARAEVEITEKAVALFISEIFLTEEEDALAALVRQQAAESSRGASAREEQAQKDAEKRKTRKEHILNEIERVAGTELIS